MSKKRPEPTLEDLVPSFVLSLEARNRRPRTIEGYADSVRIFVNHQRARALDGGPVDHEARRRSVPRRSGRVPQTIIGRGPVHPVRECLELEV